MPPTRSPPYPGYWQPQMVMYGVSIDPLPPLDIDGLKGLERLVAANPTMATVAELESLVKRVAVLEEQMAKKKKKTPKKKSRKK